MKVICKDRPHGDIVYDLSEKGAEKKMGESPFTLKEKGEYKIQVSFKVQHEIVAGLKIINLVYRKGVRGMFFVATTASVFTATFHSFNLRTLMEISFTLFSPLSGQGRRNVGFIPSSG